MTLSQNSDFFFFVHCTFYKVMTHSVLDSMLPRMNKNVKHNVKNVKWFSDEGKLKAKLQKNYGFLYCLLYAGRTET